MYAFLMFLLKNVIKKNQILHKLIYVFLCHMELLLIVSKLPAFLPKLDLINIFLNTFLTLLLYQFLDYLLHPLCRKLVQLFLLSEFLQLLDHLLLMIFRQR